MGTSAFMKKVKIFNSFTESSKIFGLSLDKSCMYLVKVNTQTMVCCFAFLRHQNHDHPNQYSQRSFCSSLYEESPTGSQWGGWGGAVPRWLAGVLPPPRDREGVPSQKQTGIIIGGSAARNLYAASTCRHNPCSSYLLLCSSSSLSLPLPSSPSLLPSLHPSPSTRCTNVLWMWRRH